MFIQIKSPSTWVNWAACKNVDTNIFFPERGDNTLAAKQICYGCPVRTECAEYSIAIGEKMGVWGGAGEKDRRLMRKVRALARKQGLADGNPSEDKLSEDLEVEDLDA
jgi:WhiB family transcriptional regulator, redox-sensing transcriptional regulator